MPEYADATMQKFQHIKPARPQYDPQPWTKLTYGQIIQLTKKSSSCPK